LPLQGRRRRRHQPYRPRDVLPLQRRRLLLQPLDRRRRARECDLDLRTALRRGR
jgi:hypothetical protein